MIFLCLVGTQLVERLVCSIWQLVIQFAVVALYCSLLLHLLPPPISPFAHRNHIYYTRINIFQRVFFIKYVILNNSLYSFIIVIIIWLYYMLCLTKFPSNEGAETRNRLKTWKVKVKITQSCQTLCDPMDYTVHGILQARILEQAAFPFSRGSSPRRNWTGISCIAGGFFTNWAIRETTVRRGQSNLAFFFTWRFGTCLLPGESTILFPWGALLWLLMRVSWSSWISAPSIPWLPSASRQSGPQGR